MLTYGRIRLDARLAQLDERGASAVEYGLLIAGIAAIIVAAVFLLGDEVKAAFERTNTCISAEEAGC